VLLLCSLLASSGLHLIFFTTHQVASRVEVISINNTCWRLYRHYFMEPTIISGHHERIYYTTTAMLSIVIPTLAMLVCSALIVTQFTFKELGEAFSQRRRCVLRLTIATTLSHLLLEGPALITFGAVVLKGNSSS